ncbi:MAG TPA: hypothetical protein VK826_20585 [Bacteroidia bacterium]|nr:hypothetical protein [Bacteroidia bacterium]
MQYEQELWPNNRRRLKSGLYAITVLAIGIIMVAVATIFWDDYVGYHQTWGGGSREDGWPTTVRLIGFWISVFGVVLFIVAMRYGDRKNPSFKLNKDGVLINNLGWNQVFFPWSEIAGVEEVTGKKWPIANIRLVAIHKTIAAQDPKFQSFLKREHVAKKKPIIISGEYVREDASFFVSQLKKYYEQGKSSPTNP